MIKYSFKEDTTQRIFRIEEEDAEDENNAKSDEEVNEILASSVQDDNFQVIFQEKQAIFEKMHNLVGVSRGESHI